MPTPGTTATGAAALADQLAESASVTSTSSRVAQAREPPPSTPDPTTPAPTAPTPDIQPGRATRGVSSYLGVAANFGLTGDSALGDGTNVAVLSKIGLLNYLSVRPAVVIIDEPAILIPITYDFNLRTTETLGETFSIVPYAGAGIGIKTGDDKARWFSTIWWFRCSSR